MPIYEASWSRRRRTYVDRYNTCGYTRALALMIDCMQAMRERASKFAYIRVCPSGALEL